MFDPHQRSRVASEQTPLATLSEQKFFAMVNKPRWLFKDVVVRRLMNDLARYSRSLEEVQESRRSPEAKKKTAKRPQISVKSARKK